MAPAATAANQKRTFPADVAVDAEVDLGTAASGYLLQARPNVSLPDLEQAAAHEICPYAKATWGNIEVVINLA